MSILYIGDPAIHSLLLTLWHYSRFAVTALAVSLLLAACDGPRGSTAGENVATDAALAGDHASWRLCQRGVPGLRLEETTSA